MYNRQLDTFLKVAELGSFSKAAEALYITPSAVVQQINNLESNLGAKLLHRTQRGTTLTAAGEVLCQEGKKLIRDSENLRLKIGATQEGEGRELCVGTTPLEQCRLFYKLWRDFTEDERYRVRVKTLQNMDREEELADVDIIEGVYIGSRNQKALNFLPLTTIPIVHAVWKEHPLAEKKILRYEDMQGHTMVTLTEAGHVEQVGRLKEEAEKHGINIVTMDKYDLSVFSMCIANGYVLQMPLCGKYIHSELVAIPCGWDYSLPYGLYYKKNPSVLVQKFIEFVQEQLNIREFTLS